MHFFWWIGGILLVLGLLVAVFAMLAKDGYEDESGFHSLGNSNAEPGTDLTYDVPRPPEHATRPTP